MRPNPLALVFSSDLFTYDREQHMMVTDASRLGGAFAPGAPEVSHLAIQSKRTGRTPTFELVSFEEADGEYVAWTYVPVEQGDKSLPTVTVIND
jgi:hypothetical protein